MHVLVDVYVQFHLDYDPSNCAVHFQANFVWCAGREGNSTLLSVDRNAPSRHKKCLASDVALQSPEYLQIIGIKEISLMLLYYNIIQEKSSGSCTVQSRNLFVALNFLDFNP